MIEFCRCDQCVIAAIEKIKSLTAYALELFRSRSSKCSDNNYCFKIMAFLEGSTWEEKMLRLTAVAFALALATSAQAMPLALLQPGDQPGDMVTQVREACGAGRHRVGGVCVARTTQRHVRRQVRREYRRTY